MTFRQASMVLAATFAWGLSIAPATASAACSWEWLCNGEGNCKQMPVCDLLDETPPPRPEVTPPKPPLGMKPQQTTPHRGSDVTCEQVMRQTSGGNWKWDEACFCSDASKAKDPSSPMANITRCVASQ